MILTQLSDKELLDSTEQLVKRERTLLSEVLHHLREIEHRRLFSAEGFSSLHTYAVIRLGYPDDQAQRRIAAMRLMRELPELEEKIQAGDLNLTHIGLANSAFRREEFTKDEKIKILGEIERTSTREAEKVLSAYAPVAARPDSLRSLSPEQVEYRFAANRSLQDKVEVLKGMLAHAHPRLSMGDLFEMLCDIGLAKLDKSREPAAPRDTAQKKSEAAVKREVWRKAGSKCENCGSKFALEIDHRVPKAMGGSSDPDNLRLLCRQCNQRAAIVAFGLDKMAPHLEKPN